MLERLGRVQPEWLALGWVVIQLASYGGIFYPDTGQFIRHTFASGCRVVFNVIGPTYPLVLDFFCLLLPPPLRMPCLVVLQLAGVAGTVYCVRRIGEMAGFPLAGRVAAWMTALYFPLYLYAATALTESLYIAFAAFGTLLLLKGLAQNSTWWGTAAGLLWAAAMG